MNPGALIDAVVDSVRQMSELVNGHLEGDAARVSAYRDWYSRETAIATAILNAGKPSILVAYMGTVPGDMGANMEVAKHKFALYFRARDERADNYYGMYEKLVEGETVDGLQWRYSTIHEDCYPPEKIRFDRVTNSSDDLDLWMLSFLLTQNGG
jgi:hypothetical protein